MSYDVQYKSHGEWAAALVHGTTVLEFVIIQHDSPGLWIRGRIICLVF